MSLHKSSLWIKGSLETLVLVISVWSTRLPGHMGEFLIKPFWFIFPQMHPALKRVRKEVKVILQVRGKTFVPLRHWLSREVIELPFPQGELPEWVLDKELCLQHWCGSKDILLEIMEGHRCYCELVLWLQRKTVNVALTIGLGGGADSFTAPTTPSHRIAFVRLCLI